MSETGEFRAWAEAARGRDPEALYRLVEAYLTLGLLEEAKRNAAVLGFNYPGDRWYADAYKLMTSKGLRPSIEPKAKKSLPEKIGIG